MKPAPAAIFENPAAAYMPEQPLSELGFAEQFVVWCLRVQWRTAEDGAARPLLVQRAFDALEMPGGAEIVADLAQATPSTLLAQGLQVGAMQDYSVELGERVTQEIQLDVFCEDERVDAIIALIRQHGRTGQVNAGWIFTSSIDDVLLIDRADVPT